MGTNRDWGVDQIMSAAIDAADVVNAVGFGVQEANVTSTKPARWVMSETIGSVYVMTTTGTVDYDHGWIALAREEMVFQVLGCETSRIVLCVDPDVKTSSVYRWTLSSTLLQIEVASTSCRYVTKRLIVIGCLL